MDRSVDNPCHLQVDLSRPRYDQQTFPGRAKHFFETANPLNLLVSSERLEKAAELVRLHREGKTPPGTTEDQLWAAKRLYDSAYHPITGEKMFFLGRMSCQVPANMTIIGLMMTFYKGTAAVIFWQWINQSFNAVVNYTNRGGDELVSKTQIAVPYIAATSAATVTALGLNAATKALPSLLGRFVPFAAVAAANCINIPLMRQRELKYGIPITDDDDNRLGRSKNAAVKAISQVAFSRVVMAMPGMVIPPFIMVALEKRGMFKRVPWVAAPLQVGLVGLCLVFATPLCCAIFPQRSSIAVSRLEPDVRQKILSSNPGTKRVYYNKGL